MKPAVVIDHLTRFIVACVLAFYLGHLVMRGVTNLAYIYPDQLFLFLFLCMLMVQQRRYVRLFLIDWLPFIVFFIGYTMMSGVVPALHDRVHVLEPYRWEIAWFGWLGGGDAPTMALQAWRAAHAGTAVKRVVDLVCAATYIVEFVAPLILMWVLWWNARDRRTFYHLSYTFAILNYTALATFALYPAAPPWYYMEFGDMQPSLTSYGHAPGGLLDVDRLLNLHIFSTLWVGFNPNYFAAIPSLHGAWPVVVALYTVLKFGARYRWIFLYPVVVAFAGMYFRHHYLVDYLVGWAYLAAAFVVVDRLLMPKVFDRVVDYSRLRAVADRGGAEEGSSQAPQGAAAWMRGWGRVRRHLPPREVLQLFTACAFALFLELVAIRWLAAEIRLFAFLKNVPLIVCFLGLGLGVTVERPRVNVQAALPYLLTAFAVALALAPTFHLSAVRIPTGDDFWVWWSTDYSSGGRGLPVNASVTRLISVVGIYLGVTVAFLTLLFALFFGVGAMIQARLRAFEPLRAYQIDLIGSMSGIALFSVLSYWQLSPLWWFLIGYGLFFILQPPRLPLVSVAVTALTIVWIGTRMAFWSPYYRIDLTGTVSGRDLASIALTVNHVYFQEMANHSERFLGAHPDSTLPQAAADYNLPYRLIEAPGDVLVVGAGAGNDVAAALRHGAARVDAVDIDPLILRLGSRLHPEQPYRDRRVRVIVDDARSFFQKTSRRYDTIVYGSLDSHTSVSVFSSMRLDNFVYTREALRAAREHLKQNGSVILRFGGGKPWLLSRLAALLRETFGQEPLAFRRSGGGGGLFVFSRRLRPGALDDPVVASRRIEIPSIHGLPMPTDDWPYLYLKTRSIPLLYLGTLGVVVLLMLLLMAWFAGRRLVSSVGALDRRELWHFFALGAAFLLIETKSVNELSLLFGSTWIVNSAVIFGILAMAFLANSLVQRGVRPPVWVIMGGLIGSLIAGYALRPSAFLGAPFLEKCLLGGALIAAPLFFSGLLFSRSFERTPHLSQALGANLLGAFLGGVVENLAMVTGIRALTFLAIGFYLIAIRCRPVCLDPVTAAGRDSPGGRWEPDGSARG